MALEPRPQDDQLMQCLKSVCNPLRFFLFYSPNPLQHQRMKGSHPRRHWRGLSRDRSLRQQGKVDKKEKENPRVPTMPDWSPRRATGYRQGYYQQNTFPLLSFAVILTPSFLNFQSSQAAEVQCQHAEQPKVVYGLCHPDEQKRGGHKCAAWPLSPSHLCRFFPCKRIWQGQWPAECSCPPGLRP